MTLRRVAYVVNVFPKLSETFIATELAELRRRGVEVRILSRRPPTETLRHPMIADAGLAERVTYDERTFPAVLREFRPQMLHAHFATKPTAIARALAAELGVPFTFTAHRYDIYHKAPPDLAARAAAAGAVVTVSEANARHIIERFGIPAGRIHVISCGVDTERFRPREGYGSSTAGGTGEPPWVVCVARLKPFKNLALLLEACSILRARRVAFRCALVGDGPCRGELLAARDRLRLDDAVALVGAAVQDEVLAWWLRATVAVLPSDSEGMPVSLMEAAACGVPAVATAVGGVPELVEDGVTGLVTPPGDAVALARALERLLLSPGWTAELGKAARRRAEERFSLSRQVDRLQAVWTGLLDGDTEP